MRKKYWLCLFEQACNKSLTCVNCIRIRDIKQVSRSVKKSRSILIIFRTNCAIIWPFGWTNCNLVGNCPTVISDSAYVLRNIQNSICNHELVRTLRKYHPIQQSLQGVEMELFFIKKTWISILFRSFQENIPPDCSEISSGSEKDVFHQKFSVAVHPSFPVFVCSDGYIVTIVQFNNKPSHTEMMTNLIDEISCILSNTKHHDVTTVSSEVKKPQDVSATAISIVGTPSENRFSW